MLLWGYAGHVLGGKHMSPGIFNPQQKWQTRKVSPDNNM